MTTATKRPSAAELLGAPPAPTNGRGKIVHVAIDLFYRHGFHAIGIDQILDVAGVTKTTFYKHFESKDDLVIEAINERDRWEAQAWQRAVQLIAGNDPAGQLLAVYDVLDAWFNDPSFRGCMFMNAAAEFADPREPAHQAAALHKKNARDWWRDLARQAGASDPETFADRYTVVFEGTLIMRHVHGRDDAARTMKPVAKLLIEEFLPAK